MQFYQLILYFSDHYRNCSIQSVLLEALDIEMTDLFKNLAHEDIINQILGSVAIQISLANVLQKLNLMADYIIGFGSGEFVAAYLDNYLTLKETVLGLFYVTSLSINNRNNKNLEDLERILLSRRHTYEKWIPSNEEKLNDNCAKYFANIINNTTKLDLKKIIPEAAFTLVIGSSISNIDNGFLYLVDSGTKDYVIDFFNSLGR